MITWSTCAHDLNPTENLCYHLKWEIHTKAKLYTTLNRWKLNTGCDKVRWLTKHWGNTGKKVFFLYNLYFSHNSYGSLRIQDVVHCMYAPALLTAHVKCCCPTFPQLSKNIPGNCRISKEDNRRTFPPHMWAMCQILSILPSQHSASDWSHTFSRQRPLLGVEQRIKLSHWLFLFKQHWQ